MSVPEPDFDCLECVDAAPYVLGALDKVEVERYQVHVASCPECREQVAELQVVVDALPETGPQEWAPEALRERVLATVRSEAELLRAAGPGADEPPKVARRWQLRRGSFLTAGVAIAATVAVALAINTGSNGGARVTPGQVTATVQGAHASLRQSGEHAELVVTGMPQPALGKVYEVWLNRASGSPQPTDALFSVTSRGSGAVAVPDSLHGVKEVIVTSESLGGSSRPTGPPLLRVVLGA